MERRPAVREVAAGDTLELTSRRSYGRPIGSIAAACDRILHADGDSVLLDGDEVYVPKTDSGDAKERFPRYTDIPKDSIVKVHLSPDASTKAVSWESGIELVVGNGALQHLPVIDFRCLEWIVGSDALAVVGTGAGKLYVIGPANGGRMTPGIPTEMPSSPVHFCRQVGKWVAAVVGPSGASDLYIYQLCDGKLNHAFESTLLQETIAMGFVTKTNTDDSGNSIEHLIFIGVTKTQGVYSFTLRVGEQFKTMPPAVTTYPLYMKGETISEAVVTESGVVLASVQHKNTPLLCARTCETVSARGEFTWSPPSSCVLTHRAHVANMRGLDKCVVAVDRATVHCNPRANPRFSEVSLDSGPRSEPVQAPLPAPSAVRNDRFGYLANQLRLALSDGTSARIDLARAALELASSNHVTNEHATELLTLACRASLNVGNPWVSTMLFRASELLIQTSPDANPFLNGQYECDSSLALVYFAAQARHGQLDRFAHHLTATDADNADDRISSSIIDLKAYFESRDSPLRQSDPLRLSAHKAVQAKYFSSFNDGCIAAATGSAIAFAAPQITGPVTVPGDAELVAFVPGGEAVLATSDGWLGTVTSSGLSEIRNWRPIGVIAASRNLIAAAMRDAEGKGQLVSILAFRQSMSITVEKLPVSSHMAFSPSEALLAAVHSSYGYISLWSPQENSIAWVTTTNLLHHSGNLSSVSFSGNGSMIVAASDREVVVWDVSGTATQSRSPPLQGVIPRRHPRAMFKHHVAPVCGAGLSSSGSLAASASQDGCLYVWQVATCEAIHAVHFNSLISLAVFLPNKQCFAAVEQSTGRLLECSPLPNNLGDSFSFDNQYTWDDQYSAERRPPPAAEESAALNSTPVVPVSPLGLTEMTAPAEPTVPAPAVPPPAEVTVPVPAAVTQPVAPPATSSSGVRKIDAASVIADMDRIGRQTRDDVKAMLERRRRELEEITEIEKSLENRLKLCLSLIAIDGQVLSSVDNVVSTGDITALSPQALRVWLEDTGLAHVKGLVGDLSGHDLDEAEQSLLTAAGLTFSDAAQLLLNAHCLVFRVPKPDGVLSWGADEVKQWIEGHKKPAFEPLLSLGWTGPALAALRPMDLASHLPQAPDRKDFLNLVTELRRADAAAKAPAQQWVGKWNPHTPICQATYMTQG